MYIPHAHVNNIKEVLSVRLSLFLDVFFRQYPVANLFDGPMNGYRQSVIPYVLALWGLKCGTVCVEADLLCSYLFVLFSRI